MLIASDDDIGRQLRQLLIHGRDNDDRRDHLPSSRTTRCSIVSEPKGSSAFDEPMRVDLPPQRTIPPYDSAIRSSSHERSRRLCSAEIWHRACTSDWV